MTTQRRYLVCELTDAGIQAAKGILAKIREGKPSLSRYSDYLEELGAVLTQPRFAVKVEPQAYVERRVFQNRLDAAVYLIRRLGNIGVARVIGNLRFGHGWACSTSTPLRSKTA